MKPHSIVSEQEREMCLFAPKSMTAEIVRLRLALLKLRREVDRVLKRVQNSRNKINHHKHN